MQDVLNFSKDIALLVNIKNKFYLSMANHPLFSGIINCVLKKILYYINITSPNIIKTQSDLQAQMKIQTDLNISCLTFYSPKNMN